MTGATGSATPGGAGGATGSTGTTGTTATGPVNPGPFSGQVNPTATIHNPPPAVASVKPLTGGQIAAFGTIVVDLILAQVAFAIGGVNILGAKPFAFLTDWGNQLVKQASDAYKNSFAVVDVVAKNPPGTTTSGTLNSVYSAAAAVQSTGTEAKTIADGATGSIQTTWNALWDGAKGTTGSSAKTAADVKAAVTEVRNTGIDADGKAQDTIDGLYSAVMGGDYNGLPANYVKPALTGLTYTTRNNVASGSNLVIDPGGENAAYWTGQVGVTQSAIQYSWGTHSVQLTASPSGTRTLFFNTIDTGAVQPYIVNRSEIYYVECYVKCPTPMDVELVTQIYGSTVYRIADVSVTVGNAWTKLSGQYTIPVGVNNASFGIRVQRGSGSAFVDNMLVREITNAQGAQNDVESTWNQIYNGVYNLNLSGRDLTDVFNAMYLTKQTADGGVEAAGAAQVTADGATGAAAGAQETADGAQETADEAQDSANNANDGVAQLFTDLAGQALSGTYVYQDFSSYADSLTLGSVWAPNYNNSNSSVLGITSGTASWISAGADSRNCLAVYNAAATGSEYQRVGIMLASVPNLYSYTYVIGRSNLTATSYVYLQIGRASLQLGYVVNGAKTVLHTFNGYPVKAGNSYTLECGTSGTNAYTFRVWENKKDVMGLRTDSYQLSKKGDGFGYAGFGGDKVAAAIPGKVSSFWFYDNKANANLGSGLMAYRNPNSGVINIQLGTRRFPDPFFNLVTRTTDDITYTAASSNKVTVSVAGWYVATVTGYIPSGLTSSFQINANLWTNGSTSHAGPDFSYAANSSHGLIFSGTFVVYLNAGEYVEPGYGSTANVTNALSATSLSTWSVVFIGNKKATNPSAATI